MADDQGWGDTSYNGHPELKTDFEFRDGRLTLRDGIMRGSSLGLLTEGTIDVDSERLDLAGVAIPFYWINSAFGHIPIIGDWLVGDQPGGGIFTASYRVNGQIGDPRVSVNVFTAFFPSVVRYILEVLAQWLLPAALKPTVDGVVNAMP